MKYILTSGCSFTNNVRLNPNNINELHDCINSWPYYLQQEIGNDYKVLNYFLILWVFLFSYSRIYLGVHFPLDTLFGLIFGLFFGITTYQILENFILFRSK